MVLELSLPGRPGDHILLPQCDMEAGSSPPAQAVEHGDSALAGRGADSREQHRNGAAAHEAEELADLAASSASGACRRESGQHWSGWSASGTRREWQPGELAAMKYVLLGWFSSTLELQKWQVEESLCVLLSLTSM